ncbi:MAG: single-stranded-DNA-specific exonuclease RecJ [Fimbriimonadaceae bacterium]
MSVIEQGSVWNVRERSPDKESALERTLGLPPLVAATLIGRGLEVPEEAEKFLRASLDDLHDPRLLPDYDLAVKEILGAKDRNERIYVHGDYDVDGVTSAALLTRFLRVLGCDVVPHVPHRMREGYGIHLDAVAAAAASGAKLFLTCDCGVSAFEQVEAAHAAGMRVVVTDHHSVGDTVPAAEAVVNPHRPGSAYPWPELSGVGVAFKLCAGITEELGHKRDAYYRAYLDLAVLGTVADVMPLLDENRVITKHGLLQLARTKKTGLKALIEVAELTGRGRLTARNIGFQLGPRINAVGRIDDSGIALELMLTDDVKRATELAEHMNMRNEERRAEQGRMLAAAMAIAEREQLAGDPAIVVAGEGWHPGIIGIVAGKLVEAYGRPAFVISIGEDGSARGSARSIPGFHLGEALDAAREHLDAGGGHEMAAGFSLDAEGVGRFAGAIREHAAAVLKPEDFLPHFLLDAFVSGAEAGPEAIAALSALEPFGQGNPEPLFATMGARLLDVVPTSNPDHARVSIEAADGTVRQGMAFGIGRALAELDTRQRLDFAFSLEESVWNGKAQFRWIVRDYRPSSS